MSVGGWLPATLAAIEPSTPSARVLRLDVPGWTGNLPGQHLDLRLTAEDGYQAVRSYSIASFGPGEQVELGVDEVPDGEVSPYLVLDARPGDAVEVKGPLGAYFVWRDDDPSPVQLIAGGSGIVPLIAMARARAASASAAPFRLLYSVRRPDDAMYRDEIGTLGDGVDVTWAYTREAPVGWTRPAGRVSQDLLRDAAWSPAQSPAVFVCGPTGFVETVATALVALGHDPARVRTERFGG
ncbi:oxidoreductase [Microbacterium sp. Gd 4-13]|uniref:FAD-binding oxidoreductase n=1 Tax=Microbacterium sp. Gd 4-13 TaxID=2173179 RepID=UPI000D574270|nr:FAD-binding oxidoreductase [Microbacterium sp. Gd 4-13]PVW06210.1 oxidoreductase [Microbacterium sp. Gd 4-13]